MPWMCERVASPGGKGSKGDSTLNSRPFPRSPDARPHRLTPSARAPGRILWLMADDPFENLREQLMAEIAAEAVLTMGHTGRASFSGRVMRIIAAMPRHEFVPIELQPYAY